LLHGAEGGEAFDALGAALLDAFDFVDLVAGRSKKPAITLPRAGSSAGSASATAATSASNSARWWHMVLGRGLAERASRPSRVTL
jgi:hypothetical protein